MQERIIIRVSHHTTHIPAGFFHQGGIAKGRTKDDIIVHFGDELPYSLYGHSLARGLDEQFAVNDDG